jgi:hypothetical protein
MSKFDILNIFLSILDTNQISMLMVVTKVNPYIKTNSCMSLVGGAYSIPFTTNFPKDDFEKLDFLQRNCLVKFQIFFSKHVDPSPTNNYL